ncbi:MAG: transposase, partial [Epsilonproteobacteria bacterium]|nr:transposase [Campylobacterota bacterium]
MLKEERTIAQLATKYQITTKSIQNWENKHTQLLQENGIAISMNGKGRSIDNIAIERFFRTLKHSCIYINNFGTIKKLKNGINEY